jgi:hypothetical protein
MKKMAASVSRITNKLIAFIRFKLRRRGKTPQVRLANRIRHSFTFLHFMHSDEAKIHGHQTLRAFLADSAEQKQIQGSFLSYKQKSKQFVLNILLVLKIQNQFRFIQEIQNQHMDLLRAFFDREKTRMFIVLVKSTQKDL